MARSFLQSEQWADFKHAGGWQYFRIARFARLAEASAKRAESRRAGFFALRRTLPGGLNIVYLPEIDLKVTADNLCRLIKALKTAASKQPMTFARIEFFTEFDEADPRAITRAHATALKAGLRKAPQEIQPEHRQLIDLRGSDQKLLAQMKPKGRYNIKVAQRHGVVVQQYQISNIKYQKQFKIFYDLYQQAARRDGFTPRPFFYFENMAAQLGDHLRLYIAYGPSQPLAGALLVLWRGRASYLYGGSSSVNRNMMAPSLLHWEIMRQAKVEGIRTYDLLAIAPARQLNHKFAGLRRFKEQFGGRPVRVLGSYDLILDWPRYILFVTLEKFRRRS